MQKLIAILGLALMTCTASAATQNEQANSWTTNPNLAISQGGWWARPFQWDSRTGQTWDPVAGDANNYGRWSSDGKAQLGAYDTSWWDTVNNAAWVTQDPSSNLAINGRPAVTFAGRVSNTGTTASYGTAWTGAKFDAWLRNRNNGQLIYIEMYFLRTGLNEGAAWCTDLTRIEQDCRNELARYLVGGTLPDYIVDIRAFQGGTCILWSCLPDFVDVVNNADGSKTYRVDLKAMSQRAARYFGLNINDYDLDWVGATLESGEIGTGDAGRVWSDVNYLRVSYA